MSKKKFEIASTEKVESRKREIQFLVNIQEPDPDYQPYLLTDYATVYDVNLDSEEEIRQKYSSYFKEEFTLSFDQPLWNLVDEIKNKYHGWPDDWAPDK